MLGSLRTRLLVLVLVAVVPTIVIVVLSAREQRRLLVEQASGGASALGHLVAEHHQRSVDAARGLLLSLSRMRSITELDGPACGRSLGPLLARERVFVNMGAVREDGRLFCSAAPATGRIDLSDRAYYREALRTGGLGVGEYVVSRVRGKGALGFGYPVTGDDGRVVAVAFASLAVEQLQRELDGLDLPSGVEVAVLDRGGVAVSARPDGAAWAGRPFAPELVAALRRAGRPSILAGTDGVSRLYDLHEVTAADGTIAMRVVAGFPTGALLDPVNRLSNRTLLASLLASALALAAAVLMAEFLLVRPLGRLAAASRRIAAGDWSARTGLRPARDELGELVRSFDEMARSLEQLDREKRQREEQLRQAQKMEAVGQLAGGVAHDFNNLLTAILSAASTLRDRLSPDDPGHEDARDVLESAERAAALTRQLLAFSRRQHVSPRILDLGEVVRGMERMLQRLLGERISLAVDVRAPGRVHADAGQIELALLNLAVNARDAMPQGGRLEIVVEELAAEDPARPVGVEVPAGPLSILAVRDTGSGMDGGVRARIFEPFFTTKGPGRGTGLGLSTVQGIVAQWGGAIRVDSEPGSGSAFRLYFPGAEGECGSPAAAPRARPASGRGTLLVVEDDDRLRGIVRRNLASHGYAVLEASSPTQAIAFTERHQPPSLVLTDVILPEGNGVDLASALRRRWPGVRVLFMSGYPGEHLAGIEPLPPRARFLQKPFTPDVLLAKVRETLEAS